AVQGFTPIVAGLRPRFFAEGAAFAAKDPGIGPRIPLPLNAGDSASAQQTLEVFDFECQPELPGQTQSQLAGIFEYPAEKSVLPLFARLRFHGFGSREKLFHPSGFALRIIFWVSVRGRLIRRKKVADGG